MKPVAKTKQRHAACGTAGPSGPSCRAGPLLPDARGDDVERLGRAFCRAALSERRAYGPAARMCRPVFACPLYSAWTAAAALPAAACRMPNVRGKSPKRA